MFNSISFRATFCRNGRLALDGSGLVQIECSQQRRKAYFSTRVKVEPGQFACGQVINHPIAKELNFKLRQMIYDLQTIEVDCLRRGVPPTLELLREAWRENSRPTARIVDFGQEMLSSSSTRREMTRRSYKTLFNSLDKFRPGALLQDVDYSFVCKYDTWLKAHGSGHNTRVCRLRLLRTIILEARKRGVVQQSPFDRFKIPAMTSKRGFLATDQVRKIEGLSLVGKTALVRDLFLFSCYTGLRFSDVQTLRDEHMQKGWIIKKMVKTQLDVRIPVRELFDGKAMQLIERYGSVSKFTEKTGSNATVNKHLKDVLKKAGCGDKGFTFHTARHTFASLLLQQGVQLSTIQHLLGHSNIQTTGIYAEVTDAVIAGDVRKAAKKKRVVNSGQD